MTYSSKELERRGFPPRVISMRRWRRDRGLTMRSMATMLGLTTNQLQKYELQARDMPHQNARTAELVAAFIARWEEVPAAQAALAEVVHRDRLIRSAVASARRRKVLENEKKSA